MLKKIGKTMVIAALFTMFCGLTVFAADEGDGVVSDAIEPRVTKEWDFYTTNGQSGSTRLTKKSDSEQTAYIRTTFLGISQGYSCKFYTEVKNTSGKVVCSPFTIYGITLYTTPYTTRGVAGQNYEGFFKNQVGSSSGQTMLSGRWTP